MSDIPQAFARQIAFCESSEAPFTAAVLRACLDDWQAMGALRAALPSWPGDAWADAVALRTAAALHAMAIDHESPALAALYARADASAGVDAATLRMAVSQALATHAPTLRRFLASPPQTNEVGRSAVLLGGFAAVAVATHRPLALLELGASAGLNQGWPHFRYELGDGLTWGPAASPVTIRSRWHTTADGTTLPPTIAVASSHACDVAPIDLRDPRTATTLAAYVWPEQHERLARLRAAIALAQRHDVTVDRADAADWLDAHVAAVRPGVTRVVAHTVMWQYLPPATQARIRATLAAAGARASDDAPLAWLAFEPRAGGGDFALTLTRWPGGATHELARAHPHGREVHWHAVPIETPAL